MKQTFMLKPCACLLLVTFSSGQISGFAQATDNVPSRIPLVAGTVHGNTYENSSLGLEFTPPPGLKFRAPELKGIPGSVPLLVTVAAWADKNLLSASGGAVFYADDLGYYPQNRRSTKAYVQRVTADEKKEGLELAVEETEQKLGGLSFARVDFRHTSSYEAVFIKACDVYAFVFIFAASDLKTANSLVAKASVKLNPKTAACGEVIGNTR